jgi:hypothetical protein
VLQAIVVEAKRGRTDLVWLEYASLQSNATLVDLVFAAMSGALALLAFTAESSWRGFFEKHKIVGENSGRVDSACSNSGGVDSACSESGVGGP